MIGRRLSHYRIDEKLGAGGMGEVYRAHDEKLGRDVAVKVLPAGLLGSQPARERFQKEALALSRLSHPHIATLLDFDSADGDDFLVMELVEGKTLVEALHNGPLPEKEVVRLGTQLARGLQTAHEHGVVHRDLKPGNLALTPDGLLKVLDFGLARLEHLAEPGGGKTASTDTAVGHVAGTPAYMAPEQLLGKPADARTDVYGAGACLYEMATGRKPFGSKSGVELTDAVLHQEPASPRTSNGSVSPGLESVIVKCLDKDPGLRYQTAKELLVDLERLQAAATSGSASQAVAVVKARRRRWPWLLAAGGLALVGSVSWLIRSPPPPRVLDTRQLTGGLGAIPMSPPTLATDGTRVYYIAQREGRGVLLQVPIVGGDPVEIPLPAPVHARIHGYVAAASALLVGGLPPRTQLSRSQGAGGSGFPLWVVPVPGGAARSISDLEATIAAPSADGERIIFVRGQRLFLASRDGLEARELLTLPTRPWSLAWSPDGRRVRFAGSRPGVPGSWIWETSIDGGTPRPLWPGEGGEWTADGHHFVFQRSDPSGRTDLYAVREGWPWPWSSRSPSRLTFGPVSLDAVRPSPDGRRLFAWGSMAKGELVRYDVASGRFEPFLGGASIQQVVVSRDGRWLAWTTWPQGVLWRSRVDGSERLQLTRSGLWAGLPRWSPDGKWLAFTASSSPGGDLSVSLVSASGGDVRVLASPEPGFDHWDVCWLGDGASLVFSHAQVARPGLFRIDTGAGTVSPFPGAEDLQFPKCGPHGEVFALVSRREPGPNSFRLLSPTRATWESLGSVPAGVYATFTPDGRALIGLNPDPLRVEKFSIDTRRSEVIVDLRDKSLTFNGGAPWMGLAPDGSPLFLLDRSTSDLYALDWETP